MKMIDLTEHLYLPHIAEQVAAELQSEDDEWIYTAIHDPQGTGWSYVQITDENGAIIGKF